MTDPTPQAEQRVCMHCGVAIKPWTDRYVDMAGGELCQDGTQGQFPRRHTPAEPAIEVAPQGKMLDEEAISECTNCPTIMSLGENEPYRHPHTNAVLCNSCNIDHIESELDRARDALRSINRLTSPGNRTLDDFMRDSGLACDIARAALKPVSDRQPEGETK